MQILWVITPQFVASINDNSRCSVLFSNCISPTMSAQNAAAKAGVDEFMNGEEILCHDELQQLLNEALAGSDQDLATLLDLMRPSLNGQAQHSLGSTIRAKLGSSDVVQESMLKVFQGFSEFRGETVGEFRAWLAQIVEHRAVDAVRHFRAKKRDVSCELPLNHDPTSSSDLTGSQIASSREEELRLLKAIDRLPEKLKQIVTLRYYEQLSFEEISQEVGRPRETVRRHWATAIDRISQEMEADG